MSLVALKEGDLLRMCCLKVAAKVLSSHSALLFNLAPAEIIALADYVALAQHF